MRQRLGQHFLINSSALKKIVLALNVQNGETLIEIGPGHGELTDQLKVKNEKLKIIAIEKDHELTDQLKEKYKNEKYIEILEGDALRVLPNLVKSLKIKDKRYILTGNIPYYITGFLFRTISELPHKPTRSIFTIQKEVALRACATPPQMNLFAASLQAWAEVKVLQTLKSSDFNPPPKVESAIIELTPTRFAVASARRANYYNFIKKLFKQPRKTIINNLSDGFKISKNEASKLLKQHKIDVSARPQNLSTSQIKELSSLFSKD